MAANERVVNLAVRAKDEFSKVFKQLEEAGRRTQLLFVRDTRKALNETQGEIQRVSRELRNLSTAEGDNRQAVAALVVAKGKLIERASVLSGNLKRVLENVRATSAATKGGYAAFNKLADGMDVSKAKAERLRREITALNSDIGKAARTQASLVIKNPFAAADAGRDASNFIQAAKQKKAELRALMIAEREAAGVTQMGMRAWFQYTDALRASDGAIDQAKVSVASIVPELKKKAAASREAGKAERQHAEAIERTDRVERRMTGRPGRRAAQEANKGKKGDAQDVEVFGLKPWQLTNLGYQVNDVVSGLAMGQAPLQILAQQAGQFVQIWPNVMVGLARSIPLFLGLGAALTPVIAAFARAGEEAASMRQFASELALSADGGRYAATELTNTTIAIKNLGVATDDARAIVRGFMKEGFDTSQMVKMTEMAKQLAAVTGMEIPEAAQKIAKAFSGNAESVRELDKELNFLTASQLEQMRAMEESGDKAGALAFAQGILQQKLKDTIQPATDFEIALKDLKSAWDALVQAVANSGIVELGNKFISTLGESARGWAFALNVLTKGYDAAIEEAALQAASDKFGTAINEQSKAIASAIRKREQLQKKLVELNAALAQQQNSDKAMFGPNAKDSGNTQDLKRQITEVEGELKKVNEEQERLTEEIKNGTGEQEKAAEATKETAEATEEQKKAAADVDAVIQNQLKTLQEQLDLTLQTSKEQFIQNALIDARNAAMEKAKELGLDFLGLTKEQTEALREQAGLLFDAQQGKGFASGLGNFSDGIEAASAMIRQFEGFSATPYWDVNAYRIGFGSDTITTATGEVKKVVEGMVVTVEDSVRDLNRRIREEFAPKVASQIGQERFDQFAPLQQAALVSIAYNYGELPGRIVEAVRTGTNQEIASAIQGLGGDNGGINNGRRAKEASAFTDEVDIENTERIVELEEERNKKAKEYNESSQQRIEDKQFELQQAGKEARDAAIAKAIREEELEAQKAGVELTKERRDEIARLTGELFDQQNVEAEVNRLMEQRAIILEKLEIAQKNGDAAGVAAAKNELANIDTTLEAAIDKAIAFWEAMGGSGADLAIDKLGLVKAKLQETADELQTKYLPTAEEMNDRLAEIGANAFDTLAQKAAEGTLSFRDFFDALRQGIAQFLIDIGRAIIKQALFNALSGGTQGGGAGGWLSGLLGKIFHDGGVVGGSAPSRMVNPAIFAGAMRYHSGGVAGLKPNEVPIIAEKGEEVLTESDPRHRKNAADSSSVKIVNVFDPAEVLEKALATEVGERVLVNFMSRRSRQISGVLG